MSDEPWFRRWFGFGLLPTRWQGWALIAAVFAVEATLIGVTRNVETGSPLWWLCASLGFAIFLVFWWTALSRMER